MDARDREALMRGVAALKLRRELKALEKKSLKKALLLRESGR